VQLFRLCRAVAVVVAFFICWAPFHVQRLVSAYSSSTHTTSSQPAKSNSTEPGPASDQQSATIGLGETIFFYVSGILYYVSSVINPILYNIMSLKFREAFKDTIFDCCCCLRGTGFMTAGSGSVGGHRLRINRLQASINQRYSGEAPSRRETLSINGQRGVVFRGGTGSFRVVDRLTDRRTGNDLVGIGAGGGTDGDCKVKETDGGSTTRRYRFYGRQSVMSAAAAEVRGGLSATSHRQSSRLLVNTAVPIEDEYVGLQVIGESASSSGTAVAALCSAGNLDSVDTDINVNRTRSIVNARPRASLTSVTYNGGRSTVNRSVLHVATPSGTSNASCRLLDPSEKRWNINWFRPSHSSRSLEDCFA